MDFRQRLRYLLLTDILCINLGFIVGYALRYRLLLLRDIQFDAGLSQYAILQLIFNVLMLVVLWLEGAYTSHKTLVWIDQLIGIVNSSIKVMFFIWALIFLIGPTTYSRLMLLWIGLAVACLLSLSRFILTRLDRTLKKRGHNISYMLVVGAGETGRTVMRNIVARPELGYRIAGFLDDHPVRGSTDIGRFKALGSLEHVQEVLTFNRIDEVVIALPWSAQDNIVQVVNHCNHAQIPVRVVPSLLQINFRQFDMEDLGGIPLMGISRPSFNSFNFALKRVFDVMVAILVLVFSAPMMAFSAALIRLESKGAAVFRQRRAGQFGVPFELYKLRSMVQDAEEQRKELLSMNEADGPLFKIKHDPRVTRVGKVLRKLSLDELPQFWNVLKGEMSVVGPRPALMDEVNRYQDWHHTRLNVKPGITGLWQISGRSDLTFDEMCLLDMYYIENWSLSNDVKILLKTVGYLFSSRGAY